jgi:hypothetical protein
MGQEIVHCAVCGVRIRGVDFEGGGAARHDAHSYCKTCAHQAGIAPDPAPKAKTPGVSTVRIPVATARRAVEVAPPSSGSNVVLWGGVATGVVVVVAAALLLGGGSSRREPSPDSPSSSSRARDPERAKPAGPSATTSDLAALDRKIADAVSRERFRDAFALLESERNRHAEPEWAAALQRSSRDLDTLVKKLYQEIQAKMDDARRRGADGEIRFATDRIAAWGLSAYPAVPAPSVAAPAAPLAAAPSSAPAAVAATPVPAPAPAPDAPAAAPAPVSPSAAPIPFSAGSMKWSVLTPLRASAAAGSRLTILEDGSVLASGENPERDRYEVVVQTSVKNIVALRLEMLPDPSLPRSGPGRSENGNYVLTELQAQLLPDPQAVSGTPIPIERAAAEYEQLGFQIVQVLDGRNDTGWANHPRMGRANEAVFELRSALPAQAPLTLLFVLDHQSRFGYHLLGRFRLSATTSKGAASELLQRPPPAVDPGPVDAAIRRGVDWLRQAGSPGAEFGEEKKLAPIRNCDELLLLTFLHSGVPESDPKFQQLLASVLAGPYVHTYTVALRAMALEELDRVRYQPHIARCAQFLLDNQLSSGQWSYGEPSLAVETIRAEIPPVASASPRVAASSTSRPKPKVEKKISVRPTRTPPGNGDVSNSQYAALGIRACVDAGILLPKEVLMRAVQAYTLAQLAPTSKDVPTGLAAGRKPRGWCYDSPCACPLHRPYGTTTAGAVSSLAIYDHLLARDAKKDLALQDGLAWLQVNYAVDTVPGPIEWDKISKNTYVPYYLYALERAMILTGNERLGTHAWYADAVKYLLDAQKPDGSWWLDDWGRDVWDTCFALLFLKRSTRPLVASTDRVHLFDDDKK